jgi:hypothetical protein
MNEPETPTRIDEARCSFCLRKFSIAGYLAKGPDGVCICKACVQFCAVMIDQESDDPLIDMPCPANLLVADGQPLPFAYRWLVGKRLLDFGPWRLITEQGQSDCFRQEYRVETSPPNLTPVKDMQPFAKCKSTDDVAGFVIDRGNLTSKVVLVHLTFSNRPERPGYPDSQVYDDLWEWLKACIVTEMQSSARLEEEYYRSIGPA